MQNLDDHEETRPAARLVAAYAFPPYDDPASVAVGKRVRERGEPVDLVLNALEGLRVADPALVRLGGDQVRRAFTVRAQPAVSSWQSVSEYRELGLAAVRRWEEAQGPYASVYSRVPFVASHFLALSCRIRTAGTRWEAEFGEPLSHDAAGNPRAVAAQNGPLLEEVRRALGAAGFRPPDGLNTFEWAEAAAFGVADSIVFTNEHQRDFMLERCPDPELAARAASVAVVSPLPALPSEFYGLGEPGYELDPGRRHIGYFGSFSASRSPGVVLDAVAMLPTALRDSVQVHVFTPKPKALQEQVHARGLDSVVKVSPFLGYLDFLALSRRMDCLLVTDAASASGSVNPLLPEKWSDYQGSGRPVWGVVEEGSCLDRQQLDHRSPIGHVSAAAQVLSRIAAGE